MAVRGRREEDGGAREEGAKRRKKENNARKERMGEKGARDEMCNDTIADPSNESNNTTRNRCVVTITITAIADPSNESNNTTRNRCVVTITITAIADPSNGSNNTTRNRCRHTQGTCEVGLAHEHAPSVPCACAASVPQPSLKPLARALGGASGPGSRVRKSRCQLYDRYHYHCHCHYRYCYCYYCYC